MNLSRVFLYSSALTMLANYAVAKYCVKLPTCEELGYIYSADKYPNNRSIKCPFDTKKILLLDYCQAYGLTSCDSTSGECDECIVEKAEGTKSNSGYWRYTRCNAGYSYKSGECPPTEVDTSKYPFTQGELNEEIGEVECVQSAQNVYCGYKSCNEGWDKNEGNCIVHQCDATQYPYFSCDDNGTCAECKAGFGKRYSAVICNSGYNNISNLCRLYCSSPGKCIMGDIYAYNGTPIGVVFYNDSTVTKIVALTNVDSTGAPSSSSVMYWANVSDYNWGTGATQNSNVSIAFEDMNGKYNTDKILSYVSTMNKTAEAVMATRLYAPSICEIGSFCAKGNWYMPAAGEVWSLYNNKALLNKSFSYIGASAFHESVYWSSTESSNDVAWVVTLSGGSRWGSYKNYRNYTRPVLEIRVGG